MSLEVTIEGLDGLLETLNTIPKRVTQKAVVRRALTQAAEPIRNLASSLAPDDPTTPPVDLHTSIMVGPKTRAHGGDPGQSPGAVVVYIGPTRGGLRESIPMEFGTFKDRAQPFMRPAWEGGKDRAFDLLGFYMWAEIDGSLTRAAARAGG